jgi:NAD(P)-dependent dehydrogenase (short-subunit alcohol dehydrogenase family)
MLAGLGCRVMAVARNAHRLAEVGRTPGISILAMPLDQLDGREAAVAETRKRLGPISILVNNAGRGGYLSRPIWDEDWSNWRATQDINLDAPFHLTHLAAQDMKQAGWGRVVMVSSTAGQVGAPDMAAYCASKHGIIGLMRSVAHDLAKVGGTCNAVLPGWVRTEMAEEDAKAEAQRRGKSVAEIWAERAASYPGGKVLEPDDVARVIAFLASDAAAAINGEAVTVSHGSLW